MLCTGHWMVARKEALRKLMSNYYISDLHLGHANAIRFDNRPFENVEQMEEEIVRRWNDRITPKDTVYILGDFCWQTSNSWIPILKKLKGRKVLIRGNHDPKHIEGKLRKLFDDVKDYKEISDNGRRVCMCHFPILHYNHSRNRNSYMLCGHVHGTEENDMLERWREELRNQRATDGLGNCGQIINVGCMMPYMDYTPRTLDELIEGVGWRV